MRHLELDLDDIDLVDLIYILRKTEADARALIASADIYLGMPEILGSTPEFKEAEPVKARAMSRLTLITNIAEAAGIDLSLPDHDFDTRDDEAEDTDEPANTYYDAPGYGEPTPTLDIRYSSSPQLGCRD